MSALFLHCRGGFETEGAAEILARAAELGVTGYCKAKANSAYVVFYPHVPSQAAELHRRMTFSALIFARQWFVVVAECFDLPVTDRVTPLVDAAGALPAMASEWVIETPDTNEGKALAALCRGIQSPLQLALTKAERWAPETDSMAAGLRLHVCFLSGTAAYVGYADRSNSAPWPMGIPRLKFPRSAPSRSTLKLEEALLWFLSPATRAALLRPGMRAVDLGAAPGGWSWQLVKHHMSVTAVDNGTLAPELLDSGLVEHRREDGFRYRPAQAVEWMVCDIVEQPIRVAQLAARWLVQGWCRRAIFNLKLPMKRRFQEVEKCLALIHAELGQAGFNYRLACKQLYHDREEVTVYLGRE